MPFWPATRLRRQGVWSGKLPVHRPRHCFQNVRTESTYVGVIGRLLVTTGPSSGYGCELIMLSWNRTGLRPPGLDGCVSFTGEYRLTG